MLVTNCPRCGKPTPARLASPDELVCASCGYDGPPSPDAAPTLHAAREFLLGRDVRKRQLDETRARALAQNAPLLFAILFVLASIPCTYEFASTWHTLRDWSGRSQTYGGAAAATVMLIAVWIFGIYGFLRVKRAQDQLRAACAALPPERKGDPARCRVCGGPLPGGDAVVRCRFCEADNFADPKLVERLEERLSHDAADYELAVARAESMSESEGFNQEIRAVLVAIVIPIFAAWPMSVLTQIMLRIELPQNGAVRYAFSMTRDGECVERASGEPSFGLSALVGKRVHVHDGARAYDSIVDEVYGSILGNIAVVRDPNEDPQRLDPRSLCSIVATATIAKEPSAVFAVDDATLYYPDVGGIYSASLQTPSAGGLDLELSPPIHPVDMSVRGSTLFFDDGTQLFRRENPTGSIAFVGRIARGAISIAPASGAAARTVFGFTTMPPAVYAFDLASTGTEARRVDIPLSAIARVASDGDDVFVAGTDARGPAVFHARGRGPAERWVSTRCEALAADHSALYCGADRTVAAFARPAGDRQVLFELPPQVGNAPEEENVDGIAVDATYVYFSYDRTSTRSNNGFVARVSKNGGAAHVLAEGLSRLGSHMEVTADHIVTTASGDVGAGDSAVVNAPADKNERLSIISAPTSNDELVVIAK